jgi:hypothetical protein
MGLIKDISQENKYARYAVTGVIIAGGALLTYYLAKKVVNKVLVSNPSNQSVNALSKDLNKKNLTYSESQYITFANTIFEAMNHSVGINWASIERILKYLKNPDDWRMLVKAFDKKKATATLLWFEGNLIDWMEYKLNFITMPQAVDILSKIGVKL